MVSVLELFVAVLLFSLFGDSMWDTQRAERLEVTPRDKYALTEQSRY